MRAETRHQLKQDRFSKVTLEAAGRTVDWSGEHKSTITLIVIAVVVVAAIAFGRLVLHQFAGRKSGSRAFDGGPYF